MKRRSRNAGTEASAWLADDRGFTLIELLVAMVVSLIVLGGGVYGIARAFNISAKSEDQATSSSTAEVGLERFVLDLRQAVNGSCTGGPISGANITVTYTTTLTTVLLCDPNIAGAPTATTTVGAGPPSVAVRWQCNTAAVTSPGGVPPETCTRTFAGSPSTRFGGVQSLELTGLVGTTTSPVCIAVSSSFTGVGPNCGSAAASASFTLISGQIASPQSLSWVGLSATVGDRTSPGAGQTAVVGASAAIPIQTGSALLNFGT
jgi:prepilin-type N-terminal cleavage/methylation domain-containing protein